MDRSRAERDTIINFCLAVGNEVDFELPIKQRFRRQIPVCKLLHTVRQPVVMLARERSMSLVWSLRTTRGD
jgi:hypothetical protein